MHAQDARIAPRQLRRLRRDFARKQHMAEIQRDAGIGPAQFLDRQKVGRNIGHQRKSAGFVRFVFQRHINRRIMIANLCQTFQTVVPHPRVIALKGVIHAVLAHPQRHHFAAHFRHRIQAALGDIDGSLAHFGVGVAKRPKAKAGVGVIAHRHTIQRNTVVSHDARQGGGGDALKMVGKVQIGGVDPGHFGNAGQKVGHGGVL